MKLKYACGATVKSLKAAKRKACFSQLKATFLSGGGEKKKKWQSAVQDSHEEVHRLWKDQSFVKWLKSSHSLVKDLSRGFSMTEHVESELLLLLLPGKQRNEPHGKPRKGETRGRHTQMKIVPQEWNSKEPAGRRGQWFSSGNLDPLVIHSHHFTAQKQIVESNYFGKNPSWPQPVLNATCQRLCCD